MWNNNETFSFGSSKIERAIERNKATKFYAVICYSYNYQQQIWLKFIKFSKREKANQKYKK